MTHEEPSGFSPQSKRGRILFVALWLVAVAAGSLVLADHQSRPGAQASAPPSWPSDAELQRSTSLPTLVVFVHPHCPCSNATISELSRLMARAHGRLAAEVLFLEPRDASEAEWSESGLVAAAAEIPGVTVHADPDGETMRKFGAVTSGQTLLYDADGRLAFSGGITPGRGHEGDSFGGDAILAHALGQTSDVGETAVFGCALLGETHPEHGERES